MKTMVKILVMATIFLGAFSCSNDDNKSMSSSTAFTATLTGAQETPANSQLRPVMQLCHLIIILKNFQ